MTRKAYKNTNKMGGGVVLTFDSIIIIKASITFFHNDKNAEMDK